MKKISIYGLLLLSGIALTACSDEDSPTPSGVNDDFFTIPADATDPESVLRRDFYNETGVHLLFNETLCSTVIGKDKYGNDIVKDETIDFRWNYNSYNDYLEYNGGYITDIDGQRKVAELFKKNIIPHIEGSTLSPYSVLLFNSLESRDREWDPFEKAYSISCWRCLGINTEDWLNASTPEEETTATNNICKGLVNSRFNERSDSAEPWTDISYEYSNEYLVNIFDDWDRDITRVYELGYMGYNEGVRLNRDRIIYTSDDFKLFYDAIFDQTEEEFTAQWGEYAKIMEKYYLMKKLIEETGYKF